jgi:hypothetical protein
LIAEHGLRGYADLRALTAHDCPRTLNPSVSIYERCRVQFPELPRMVLTVTA